MNANHKILPVGEFVEKPVSVKAVKCTLQNYVAILSILVDAGFQATIIHNTTNDEPYIEVEGGMDIQIGDYVIFNTTSYTVLSEDEFLKHYDSVNYPKGR